MPLDDSLIQWQSGCYCSYWQLITVVTPYHWLLPEMVPVQDSDIGRFWSHLSPQTHQAYSYYGIISSERNPKTNWATVINRQTTKILHLSAFNQKVPSCLVKVAYLFFLKLWPKEQSSNKLKHIQWLEVLVDYLRPVIVLLGALLGTQEKVFWKVTWEMEDKAEEEEEAPWSFTSFSEHIL